MFSSPSSSLSLTTSLMFFSVFSRDCATVVRFVVNTFCFAVDRTEKPKFSGPNICPHHKSYLLARIRPSLLCWSARRAEPPPPTPHQQSVCAGVFFLLPFHVWFRQRWCWWQEVHFLREARHFKKGGGADSQVSVKQMQVWKRSQPHSLLSLPLIFFSRGLMSSATFFRVGSGRRWLTCLLSELLCEGRHAH